MFTTGRIIFTLVFIVLFIAGMIYAYRKDMKQVRKWFPKPYLVLVGIIVIYLIYFLIARF
jgi:hypothetical protein